MNRKIIAIALPCLALAACSETAFQNTLGIGKSAPDETKVRTVQPLSVPPDLELRPPASTNIASANGAARPTNAGLAAPPVSGSPAPGATTASAGDAVTLSPAPGQKAESGRYDLYRRPGISIHRPDGTRKKIAELNRELADKLTEEKRRKNPKYGTIFNMGSVWK